MRGRLRLKGGMRCREAAMGCASYSDYKALHASLAQIGKGLCMGGRVQGDGGGNGLSQLQRLQGAAR